MKTRSAGRADVAAVASLLAAVAALASVVTAALVAWQVHEEAHLARDTAALDALWHVSEQWHSPAMLDVRSGAAAALQARKPSADVAAVLDFFDEIVILVQRGALDEGLTALHFYWPLANYWAASSEYIRQAQADEPAAWNGVGALVKRFGALEAQRRQRPIGAVQPTVEEVQQFLADEQGQDECTDDSDAEKTPA